MLIDIPEERGGSVLDSRWAATKRCHFPLFAGLSPLSPSKMGIVYLIMWLGALLFGEMPLNVMLKCQN